MQPNPPKRRMDGERPWGSSFFKFVIRRAARPGPFGGSTYRDWDIGGRLGTPE
jgi:hypothetical protein